MNLEIFKHIDDVLEIYEKKRDVYKLIAEEITDFFEQSVFPESRYSLTINYRIKSPESTREKLARSSYICRYDSPEAVLENIQDIIGLRIECKFIDDESYVFYLLKQLFTETEDGDYYYDPLLSKVRLKLSDEQPQKQKNGFNIYKIDGVYLLGREAVRFELQIKALVNNFWGEIEHKIIYKNRNYVVMDKFVTDLMVSIKQSLNMIDTQLNVLYKRFRRSQDKEVDNTFDSINSFLSKMIHDTFAGLMIEQIGFNISFRESCDEIVKYIMQVNNATDLEEYGRVMLQICYILNSIKEQEPRVDTQIILDRELVYDDSFSHSIYETIMRLINIDFNWHLFFLALFEVDRGRPSDDLESFIRYYRKRILSADRISDLAPYSASVVRDIKLDILNVVSQRFDEATSVMFLCEKGIDSICTAIDIVIPPICAELSDGQRWADIKNTYLKMLAEAIPLK